MFSQEERPFSKVHTVQLLTIRVKAVLLQKGGEFGVSIYSEPNLAMRQKRQAALSTFAIA